MERQSDCQSSFRAETKPAELGTKRGECIFIKIGLSFIDLFVLYKSRDSSAHATCDESATEEEELAITGRMVIKILLLPMACPSCNLACHRLYTVYNYKIVNDFDLDQNRGYMIQRIQRHMSHGISLNFQICTLTLIHLRTNLIKLKIDNSPLSNLWSNVWH